jgi:hypothetical protein
MPSSGCSLRCRPCKHTGRHVHSATVGFPPSSMEKIWRATIERTSNRTSRTPAHAGTGDRDDDDNERRGQDCPLQASFLGAVEVSGFLSSSLEVGGGGRPLPGTGETRMPAHPGRPGCPRQNDAGGNWLPGKLKTHWQSVVRAHLY